MVSMLRQINCRLVDIPPNLSDEEQSNLEKIIREQVKAIGYKASQIEEIDGYPAVIVEMDVLGKTEPEVVIVHYLSEGHLCNEAYPINVFYSL